MLSVIVSTRDEAVNAMVLVGSVDAALHGREWELVVVDDSDDATPDLVALLRHPRVRLLHREPGQRRRGRRGAVAAGRAMVDPRSDRVVVVDADLRLDPSRLRQLIDDRHDGPTSGTARSLVHRLVPGWAA